MQSRFTQWETMFTVDDGPRIVRFDADGASGSVTTIVASTSSGNSMVIDSVNLHRYYVETDLSASELEIVRVDLDGSNPVTLLFNFPNLFPGTAIDTPMLYYINGDDVTFQEFDGATLSLWLQEDLFVLPLLRASTSTVRYEVEASKGSGDTRSTYKAKVTKNDQTTVKNFGPGAWVAHYKAVIATARTTAKISNLTLKFQNQPGKADPDSKTAVRLKKVLLELDLKFKSDEEPHSPNVGFNIH